jgi:hypothetical protein
MLLVNNGKLVIWLKICLRDLGIRQEAGTYAPQNAQVSKTPTGNCSTLWLCSWECVGEQATFMNEPLTSRADQNPTLFAHICNRTYVGTAAVAAAGGHQIARASWPPIQTDGSCGRLGIRWYPMMAFSRYLLRPWWLLADGGRSPSRSVPPSWRAWCRDWHRRSFMTRARAQES